MVIRVRLVIVKKGYIGLRCTFLNVGTVSCMRRNMGMQKGMLLGE